MEPGGAYIFPKSAPDGAVDRDHVCQSQPTGIRKIPVLTPYLIQRRSVTIEHLWAESMPLKLTCTPSKHPANTFPSESNLTVGEESTMKINLETFS